MSNRFSTIIQASAVVALFVERVYSATMPQIRIDASGDWYINCVLRRREAEYCIIDDASMASGRYTIGQNLVSHVSQSPCTSLSCMHVYIIVRNPSSFIDRSSGTASSLVRPGKEAGSVTVPR
jgi:hypothetical protein